VDFGEAREECRELYHFLRWLYGDAQDNPWGVQIRNTLRTVSLILNCLRTLNPIRFGKP
jgi:hypothetical protein